MKPNLVYLILISTLFFGCKNDKNLEGNYSICIDGEYTEVYFKQDSMRIASENEWVNLTEWKKIEINNDTLLFETFGEWRNVSKAKIKHIGMNKTELRILESDVTLNLEQMNEKLNFKDSIEFWNGFKIRRNYKKCN